MANEQNESSEPSDPLQYTRTLVDGSVSHIIDSNPKGQERLNYHKEIDELDPKESVVMALSKSSDINGSQLVPDTSTNMNLNKM